MQHPPRSVAKRRSNLAGGSLPRLCLDQLVRGLSVGLRPRLYSAATSWLTKIAISHRCRRRLATCFVLTWMLGAYAVAIAQANDEVDDAVELGNPRRIRIKVQSFDQAVFGSQRVVRVANGVQNLEAVEHPTESDFRSRMEAMASTEIETIGRLLVLTDAQKKKLRLAHRGDVERHIDRAAVLRPKLTTKSVDIREYEEFTRDLRPLIAAQDLGGFGENSLFWKTLRGMLTEEQQPRFVMLVRELRKQIIESALRDCEVSKGRLVLTGETRRQLTELLLEHSHIPPHVGPYGQSIVLLEANLLRNRIKPILNEAEWDKFEWQVGLAKRMESTLESSGVWSARHPTFNDAVSDEMKD